MQRRRHTFSMLLFVILLLLATPLVLAGGTPCGSSCDAVENVICRAPGCIQDVFRRQFSPIDKICASAPVSSTSGPFLGFILESSLSCPRDVGWVLGNSGIGSLQGGGSQFQLDLNDACAAINNGSSTCNKK